MNNQRNNSVLRILMGAALLVGACGDDARGGGDTGGRADTASGTCTSSDECDDGIACTIDACGVGGVCAYEPIDERCTSPEICDLIRGCTEDPSCGSDEECDDGFSCTLDRCSVSGECESTPVDERCAGPGSMCAPAMGGLADTGCTPAGCTSDDECDDEIDCTLDRCGVGNECTFTPVNEMCPDGEICGVTSGCFASMDCETDDECQDGDFCNGAEVCNDEFGCAPAEEARRCDDSDPCTVDSCNPDAGEGGACVFACDSSMEGCECPEAETPCDGIFDVTPVPAQTCAALLGPAQVMYSVGEVEFSCVGAVLQVDGRNVPTAAGNTPLTQTPRVEDGTFDVTTIVEGGCVETYRLQGRFVDETTFEAEFSAAYTMAPGSMFDECAISGCLNQSMMVTGTRR